MNIVVIVIVNLKKSLVIFFGAMYVSYGLGIGEGIITYLFLHQFFNKLIDLRMIPIIGSVLLILSFFNMRLSRMIWIYIFKNYSN